MKKLISLLLALATVSSLLLALPISVSAESLYIRKIVSVVYDDSGSMKGDKRAYASYAMQAFCGMLNSEDRLFLTYMSDPGTAKEVDLSAGKIQESVDSIRNFKYKDNTPTPFEAVETAYEKLKNTPDSNVNTQYWLVVITDGDFNECQLMTANSNAELAEKKKKYLNDNLGQYMDEKMPNGTKPQLTFLGIGKVAAPDEDAKKGIYTYSADNAAHIIDEMSRMADRISGRTRLKTSDIKQLDDKTIQVYSSIPLLNIAVLAQESKAKIIKAEYGDEVDIPISRQAFLEQPGYRDLVGGAFLLGDSQKAIGVGDYKITFDQKIDAQNVVVLFEPALEVRTVISVNGKEITDLKDLNNLYAGDKISLSSKIYEMGTDKEVDPALLPPGTVFEAKISVNGALDTKSDDMNLSIKDHKLKEGECELKVSVQIDGFNPIEFAKKFNVAPKPIPSVFTVSADFGSDVEKVEYEKIGNNQKLTLEFTLFKDGKAMTDPEEVKALNPKIKFSPDGNEGSVTYSKDGKVIVTPNKAMKPDPSKSSASVQVECVIQDEDGKTLASGAISYSVTYPKYGIVAVAATQPIKKTRLFDNPVSVSFYVMKGGEQLSKKDVEDRFTVSLNLEQAKLKTKVEVSDDGLITVTPYSDKEYKMIWPVNWWNYFFLPGDDITVTLDHELGKASSTVDVVNEPFFWYELTCVYLPLLLEVIALTIFAIWLYLVITKPRYIEGAKIYVGQIKYNELTRTHFIRHFHSEDLGDYNKIKKGNGRLKFKKEADEVDPGGVKIQADHGGRIICKMPMPWYKGRIEPVNAGFEDLTTPAQIADYVRRNGKLEIVEFTMHETIQGDFKRSLTPANNFRIAKYTVVPDASNGTGIVDGVHVIKSGKIFIYTSI